MKSEGLRIGFVASILECKLRERRNVGNKGRPVGSVVWAGGAVRAALSVFIRAPVNMVILSARVSDLST